MLFVMSNQPVFDDALNKFMRGLAGVVQKAGGPALFRRAESRSEILGPCGHGAQVIVEALPVGFVRI